MGAPEPSCCAQECFRSTPVESTDIEPDPSAYLEQRWFEGCRNAALLWGELKALGFRGRYAVAKRWMEQQRIVENDNRLLQPDGTAWSSPSTCRVARLMTTNEAAVDPSDTTYVARLLRNVPTLAATITVARRLRLPLRHQSNEKLAHVLDAASNTMLRPFVRELRKAIEAVQAALDLPWTTSPAEGQSNRFKMIKRTMYSRAGFALLRDRVLHAC